MKITAALFLSLLLAACANDGPAPRPITLDFSSSDKIYLDSADFQIVDRSRKMPQTPPYIGHLFSPTLMQAVGQMADERFSAVGKTGHALFVIRDLNVMEQPIDMDKSGIEGYFTRDQASKYIARVEVALEAQTPLNNASGVASATAVHTVTLPEAPTPFEKQEAYRTLLTGLMKTLNRNLDDAVHRHMARFLAPNPLPSSGAVAPTSSSLFKAR